MPQVETKNWPVELEQELAGIYRTIYNSDEAYHQLISMMQAYKENRPAALQKRDVEGIEWMSSRNTIGMMFYVDLFSNDLRNLINKVDYIKNLGVTLVHLMPLLKPREGENDGGYAVQDYREIDPKVGNMEDFEAVVHVFHKKGIRVCIDYVLNHTAKEHEWAQKAIKGIEPLNGFYFIYDNYDEPRAYESTVPQVFPKVSPGNFTYYDKHKKWVWTSFYEFQWDLNYRNPLVFNGMIENMLYLMNKGVDMLRLDAIPFMWKEMWTTCRNLYEIHPLLRMFQVITRMVAPSVALLGEAIMKPDEIITYFGHGEKIECNLLYNASYMVDIWNAIATRDGRSLGYAIPRGIPDGTYWINYARCHDDIGWGIDAPVIHEMGFDEYNHKQFLINYFQGNHWDSFARGRLYEFDPVTMDARNSGTMASLAGLEQAVFEKNDVLKEVAIRRIKLIHALFLFARGIPMMYSGDEIGALNDYSYENDPKKAHDSRWLHRSVFDWEAAESTGTLSETILNEVKALIKLRKKNPIFDGQATQTNMRLFNKHVFGFVRRSPDPEVKPLVALFNFGDTAQLIGTFDIKQHDINGKLTNLLTRKKIDLKNETILIGPQEVIILQ